MKKLLVAAIVLSAATLPAAPAMALSAQTFVSGHGSNTNDCTVDAPCRTFAHAFAVTSPGGEIAVLDAASYGPLTITKAISIVNDGAGTASIVAPSNGSNGNSGIIINAGANDAISLRGLTIERGGTNGSGVQFTHGASLTIENCVFRHLNTDGITFIPYAAANLAVSNTLLADNGSNGIYIAPQGPGAVTAVLDHVKANKNANGGFYVNGQYGTGTVKVTVSDSIAASNGDGIVANTTSFGAPTTVTVVQTVVANNNSAGLETLGATIRLAQSTVTGNANGWLLYNNGAFQSYGDNYIDGNNANQGFPAGIPKK